MLFERGETMKFIGRKMKWRSWMQNINEIVAL